MKITIQGSIEDTEYHFCVIKYPSRNVVEVWLRYGEKRVNRTVPIDDMLVENFLGIGDATANMVENIVRREKC